MLVTLDKKVKTFLYELGRKRDLINTVVTVATAEGLIARKKPRFRFFNWAKSLFRRMGFVKQRCTTSKLEIPELARKGTKLIFQHQIADLVERHCFPLP